MLASFVALSLVVTPAADPPKEKKAELSAEAKKELKKLEGKWQLVKLVTKDQEVEPGDSEMVFAFEGDTLSVTVAGQKETVAVTALDATTDPKCIDLTRTRPGRPAQVSEGVYKLDGDTLTIANTPNGEKLRPAGFDKPTDERVQVLTFKRVKK